MVKMPRNIQDKVQKPSEKNSIMSLIRENGWTRGKNPEPYPQNTHFISHKKKKGKVKRTWVWKETDKMLETNGLFFGYFVVHVNTARNILVSFVPLRIIPSLEFKISFVEKSLSSQKTSFTFPLSLKRHPQHEKPGQRWGKKEIGVEGTVTTPQTAQWGSQVSNPSTNLPGRSESCNKSRHWTTLLWYNTSDQIIFQTGVRNEGHALSFHKLAENNADNDTRYSLVF